MTKVSVSLLSIKDNIVNGIKKIDKTDANYLHIDIMDGKFVSNKSFTYGEIKSLSKYTSKKLDVHLMVKNPDKYIEDYALLNVGFITVHYEIEKLEETINKIKEYGVLCGISIKPETDIRKVFPYLETLDLILIMSVNPGMGGQSFIPSSLDKIKLLKEEINNRNLNVLISVDGGINDETSIMCIEAGADILVSGSFITNDNNYQEKISKLKNN